MAEIPEDMKDLMKRYQEKIKSQLETKKSSSEPTTTKEYMDFKKDYLPKHMTWYERMCGLSERILKIRPDKKKEAALQESINICHLNITPTGVISFSILGPLVAMLFGSLFTYLIFGSFFFVFFFIIFGLILISPLGQLPHFLANNWRLKASNQMVLCIFYVVTFMRHTSNLENAIDFAAEHIAPPLSLDLKKILWDIETEKYESVKESLDAYLETWKKWNLEFVETFHLIESSLYETSEARRLDLLDKALTVILEETYEKMLHYAQNLKSPITMLHMLGIILPILGLVILPLVVSFLEGARWYHIALLYNVALPIGVYYLGKTILSKRPTGYGETDISEQPHLKKYKNVIVDIAGIKIGFSPMVFAVVIAVFFFFIGMSPVILHMINPGFDMTFKGLSLIGYRQSSLGLGEVGPYGIGASVLSVAIPLGIGLAIGIYYRLSSQNLIKMRERAKQLEQEFASGLFQLGNRLGDGLPAEIAFSKVAETMQGTTSGSFFSLVAYNIRRLGMSVKQAMFDPNVGAISKFPSNLIESSMKVLIESVKKGPRIAAQALLNVARYIKEIHRVNERLKDLMADIISSMKSQISFLTPVIAGIVIGITSMVTTIIGKLGEYMNKMAAQGEGGAAMGLAGMFGDGIPTFYFQIIVGIYVVQILYILTVLVNGIENGSDKLNERYQIGNNLVRSTILYAVVALIVMFIFNFIAGQIMGGIELSV